jgi:hypothetical protein
MDVFEIERIARRMRMAIDSFAPEELPQSLTNFPIGACGDAARLLGAFLADEGYTGFNYICGERGKHEDNTWTSHAWLAREELIVDITADQFPDAPSKVIVIRNSKWHQKFEITLTSLGDFRDPTSPGNYDLEQFYARLKAIILSPG